MMEIRFRSEWLIRTNSSFETVLTRLKHRYFKFPIRERLLYGIYMFGFFSSNVKTVPKCHAYITLFLLMKTNHETDSIKKIQ